MCQHQFQHYFRLTAIDKYILFNQQLHGIYHISSAAATFEVTPVNDAPTATVDSSTTPENEAVTTYVLSNDNDDLDPNGGIDPTTVEIVTQPANGTVSVNAINGSICQYVIKAGMLFWLWYLTLWKYYIKIRYNCLVVRH